MYSKKEITVVILSTIAIASLLVFCSSFKSMNPVSASAKENTNPRFVEIDSSGLPGGKVYVDTKTDIEYVQMLVYTSAGHAGAGVAGAMMPLYDKDGKPMIWKPEGEE